MALIDEIREQPAVVEQLLARAGPEAGRMAGAVRRQSVDHVFVAARGSSDHAAVYAQYAFGALARLPVGLAAPSLYTRYGRPPRLGRALVIGISQSGQSPDVVAVVEEARRQGALTLAITNDGGSPLASAAASVIELGAGPERSIAATKTYTAQLATVAALAVALSDERSAADDLERLPSSMADALADDEGPAQLAGSHATLEECVVVGRGFHLATAMEWALKLKELAGIRAQAYSAADYAHGPIASFAPGGHLLAVAARGPLHEDVAALVGRLVTERSARAVVLSEMALAGDHLAFPDGLPEWLTPAVAIVPAQLFTAALTEARGLDAERPPGLSKVTLTR